MAYLRWQAGNAVYLYCSAPPHSDDDAWLDDVPVPDPAGAYEQCWWCCCLCQLRGGDRNWYTSHLEVLAAHLHEHLAAGHIQPMPSRGDTTAAGAVERSLRAAVADAQRHAARGPA